MTVYLVGAGPGDPGLLTIRGAEVLRGADVVLYDRLSIAELLDLAPVDAQRISVGKTPRGPSTPQEEINAMLIDFGRRGLEVVRLKAGDPFVFARGGEEASALAAAGVAFEVVPGISSAIAAPAYAGVPVTHRGLSTSFTVVTGHEDPWSAIETDWDAVARVGGTIVVLMGVATRADIARRLIDAGRDPATPVMAVVWGTRPSQRSVRTTLAGLGTADVSATSTIVIGDVAGLDLAWFEKRPLFGKRVVVTRAERQSSGLRSRLVAAGADVFELPTIAVVDVEADVASKLGQADWVVFTSSNAVEMVVRRLHDARAFGQARVAAVGPGTAAALAAFGIVADLVPDRNEGEGLVDAFPTGRGCVVLPQAEGARTVVADGLRSKGWTVDAVPTYRTVPVAASDDGKDAARSADAVVFTSGSTVENFVAAVGIESMPPVVVCIGTVTADTAKRLGVPVGRVAEQPTLDALVDAVIAALR